MPATDDVAIFGAATMRERVRTNKAGVSKSRVTMEISGESIGIGLDPRAYGRPVSEAIAQLLRERIKNIAAVASPGVLAARKRARKAFDEGKAWAMKQYSGGKIGPMAPAQSDRKFYDSGRLAESIVVGGNDDKFTINMAANRWQAHQVRDGLAGLRRMFEELKRYVPELGDPRKLMDSIPIRKAVNEAIRDNVIKVGEQRVERVRQLMAARIQAAKAGLTLLRSLAG